MQLNKNGITARVYGASHLLWRSFMFDDSGYVPEQTDLCSLIRIICIAAPIALAINAATIAWALFAFVYLLFALWLHVSVVGVVVLMLLSGVILVAMVFYGGLAIKTVATAEITKEIIHVADVYYHAKKARICPIVTLSGDDQ
jgi:hypothetical protein